MAIFDRFNIKIVVSAGLCGAAIALCPDAAAAPLITGGGACLRGQSGEIGAPVLAGGALAGGGAPLPLAGGPVPAAGGPVPAAAPPQVCTTGAPLTDMAGVPVVVPGPLAEIPEGIPLIALGPPVAAPPVPVPLGGPPVPVPLGGPPVPVPLGVPPVPVPLGVPPIPVPLGVPPVPVPVVAPVVPIGAPLVAFGPEAVLPAGAAPIIDMSGTGKGTPTGPAPAGAPVSGQPFLPGPSTAR